MNKFLEIILGSMERPVFAAYLTIALFSALLMMGIRANRKKGVNSETPEKFDLVFLLQDNLLKILINIGVITLAIRFSNEMVGQEITGWVAVLIGFGSNTLILKLKSLENKARK